MADPWEEATKKLIELTEAGRLQWRAEPKEPFQQGRDLPILGPVYVTETSEKRIAVYEARAVHWDDDGGMIPSAGTIVLIEFIDENYDMEWSWPSPKGRFELLEAIQYQLSDAEGFLKSFLAESST